MTKEQFLEKYQKKAVWCKTEELANEFLELAGGFGFRWRSGHRLKCDNNWELYKGNTYYAIALGGIYYENIEHKYTYKNYEIIEFQSLKHKTTYQKVLDILGLKVGDEFKLKKYRFIRRQC